MTLIERLRAWKPQYRGDGDERTIPLAAEAADRIEALEALVREMADHIDGCHGARDRPDSDSGELVARADAYLAG